MTPRAFAGAAASSILALLLLTSSAAAQNCRPDVSERRWYVPSHATVQTGGYLGALTLGGGYSAWREVLDVSAYYGWVPAVLGGIDLHSLGLRVGLRVRGECLTSDWNWVYLSSALGAVFALGGGEGFFLRVPSRYGDEQYYRRTGVRALLTIGTELQHREARGSAFAAQAVFVELTTLDEYLRLWVKSPQAEPLWSTFSTSFGYRLRFR